VLSNAAVEKPQVRVPLGVRQLLPKGVEEKYSNKIFFYSNILTKYVLLKQITQIPSC